MKKETIWGLLLLAPSRWDRYLSHSSRHTQVPVPATNEYLEMTDSSHNFEPFKLKLLRIQI